MPEIAEVRRFVDQLSKEYGGHSLLDAEVVGGRFLKEGIDNLRLVSFPMHNACFNAKGKFIYWVLDDPNVPLDDGGQTFFFMTLGMTGSFGKENKHSGVKFTFDNGIVYYNDIRHFGTVKIVLNKRDLLYKLASLGWDCLREPQIPSNFITKLRKKNSKTISEVLMDQKIFAGLGNYLRSEILYNSKIHPWRLICNLSDDELISICKSYIDIAHAAHQHGGATIATYTDLYGMAGSFYNQFKVYDQKKDPLGNDVIRNAGPDGRTIHWVPQIQTLTHNSS